uniref:NF-kappa-B inhibitor-interacting Ras-like protein n=1 Tax=Angiostrongylus cantonensis TaxID=6313 RepID=A0A0K0CTJ4_ANGCA
LTDLESDYLPPESTQPKRCVSTVTHELITRPAHPPKSASLCMGRAMRVVVVGGRRVGKTAILRQVACFEDITSKKYEPTIDDTYQVLLEEADRPREVLIFHDTGGVADHGPTELKRPYLQVADAFVIVYSVADHESFNKMDLLKKFIEKQFGKDRKEVPIVALGNMKDLSNRKVDSDFAYSWAARERVKLFEVSAKDRNTLVEFVQYLGHRHFHPIKESKFSLSKKLKAEKSNPSILMDF